jgi:hypothetical protein
MVHQTVDVKELRETFWLLFILHIIIIIIITITWAECEDANFNPSSRSLSLSATFFPSCSLLLPYKR